jgi:hypothetical protein
MNKIKIEDQAILLEMNLDRGQYRIFRKYKHIDSNFVDYLFNRQDVHYFPELVLSPFYINI